MSSRTILGKGEGVTARAWQKTLEACGNERRKRRAKIATFICAVLLVLRIVSLVLQKMDGDAPMREGVEGVIIVQVVLQIFLLMYMIKIFPTPVSDRKRNEILLVQATKTVSVGLGIANAIMQLMIAHQGLNEVRAAEEFAKAARAADGSQSTVVTTKMLREWTRKDSELEDDAKPAVVTTDMLRRWAKNDAQVADTSQAQRVGSRWRLIGATAPSGGRELTNAALSLALGRKTEFTATELEDFELLEVEAGDYIKSDSRYFQVVVQPTMVTMEMLQSWVAKMKFGSKVFTLVLNVACLCPPLYSLYRTYFGKIVDNCDLYRIDGDAENILTAMMERLVDLRFQ